MSANLNKTNYNQKYIRGLYTDKTEASNDPNDNTTVTGNHFNRGLQTQAQERALKHDIIHRYGERSFESNRYILIFIFYTCIICRNKSHNNTNINAHNSFSKQDNSFINDNNQKDYK